jgi:hypothetical protein
MNVVSTATSRVLVTLFAVLSSFFPILFCGVLLSEVAVGDNGDLSVGGFAPGLHLSTSESPQSAPLACCENDATAMLRRENRATTRTRSSRGLSQLILGAFFLRLAASMLRPFNIDSIPSCLYL